MWNDHKKARIVLARIDNRLVHGQVGVTWTSVAGANVIVVVDDEVVHNQLQQILMEAVAKASNTDLRFLSVKDFIYALPYTDVDRKIFLVVKTPQVISDLVDAGIELNKVNIGNMHYEKGKVPIGKKVYVNEDDVRCFKNMLKHGVELFIQDVPGGIKTIIKEEDLD